MRTTYIFLLLAVFTGTTFSQEVISSAGNHTEAGGIQLSWTLGEPVIETVSGVNYILTQGFHQTKLTVTPVIATQESKEISVFPNPVTEEIHILIQGSGLLNALAGLYSPEGKLLIQMQITTENTVLNVSKFPNGSYFLKINSKTGTDKTFKVVKMY